jgi:hypothetical protein
MAKPFYNLTDDTIVNVSLLEEITYHDDGEKITLKFNSGLTKTLYINTLTRHFKNFLYSLKI